MASSVESTIADKYAAASVEWGVESGIKAISGAKNFSILAPCHFENQETFLA
jgi:hypothetical protein